MAALSGTVKAVNSGDTLIIVGPSQGGPPPEKTVTFSGVSAPRLSFKKETPDEPFAWAAREYLRNFCIGKVVKFSFSTNNQPGGRQYGTASLAETGEDLRDMMVSAGYLAVRGAKEGSNASEETQTLEALEAQAKLDKVGRYTEDAAVKAKAVRDVKFQGQYDAEALFATIKNTPQQAVVEQLRDGSTLRVMLLDSMHQVTVFLAGIQCPSFRFTANAEGKTEEDAAPFAREAKHFTELRMLNRTVPIVVTQVDKKGNFFGWVDHPKGDISCELLRNGLATTVGWSLKASKNADFLRAAERAAVAARVRIYANFTPKPAVSAGRPFSGRVTEILSGDTVVVTEASSQAEQRVSLSSVRAPRCRTKPGQEEAYGLEAKEHLRKSLIGRDVNVNPDYTRDIPQNDGNVDKRVFATVVRAKTGNNVAVSLLSQGLANVQRHRVEEDRAANYDDLMAAEAAAVAAKKGLHSTAAAPTSRVNDLTSGNAGPNANKANTAAKAKAFLPTLQRSRRMQAIVEYVFAGARMKVLIPSANCVCMFALSGMRCPEIPRGETAETTSDPNAAYAKEASAFTKATCFQRDVEIEVEAVTPTGSFLGHVFVNGVSLGEQLLEQGFASIMYSVAERSPHGARMIELFTNAQAGKIGMWKNYTEPVPTVEDSEPKDGGKKKVIKLMVSEVSDGSTLYVQYLNESDGNDQITLITEALNGPEAATDTGGEVEAKRGLLCAAQFSADNQWYRVKVTKVDDKTKEATVLFCDYGNSEKVAASKLRALKPELAAIPGQAVLCHLAYVNVPGLEDDYGEDAAYFVQDHVGGRPLVARVEEENENRVPQITVLLRDGVGADYGSVQAGLLQNGLASVQPRPKQRWIQGDLEELRTHENEARRRRLRLFEYGELVSGGDDAEDEAPEFGFVKRV